VPYSVAAAPRPKMLHGTETAPVPAPDHLRDLILDAAPSAGVALDAEGVVVTINSQARGRFGLTTQDVGRPFQDLELSYRPFELRSLIDQATYERRMLRVNGVERHLGEAVQYFDILIQPITGGPGLPVGTSITFIDVTSAVQLKTEVKRVRDDLETAYEELQSTNEELETTNEELQSSIEELETTNEELQSTNEELETTNEELQSGHEELETMNDEMRIRSTDLDEARAFLAGVLSSIAAGVVVLATDLKVKSWNRGAAELWGLRGEEVLGEHFFGLDFGLPTTELREVVQRCISSGEQSSALTLAAVNRIGRTINCSVVCSPFDGHNGGVVLLMENVAS
jgi:two-component system CheB/CheR fusion protein